MITSERILPNLYEVSYYHKYSQNTRFVLMIQFYKKKNAKIIRIRHD